MNLASTIEPSTSMSSRKRSLSDMIVTTSAWSGTIDASEYNNTVLHLPATDTEDALDQRLLKEARGYGVEPSKIPKSLSESLASSSATTVGSETNTLQSRPSQSTDTTSCNSSDRRYPVQSKHSLPQSPRHSTSPSVVSLDENKSPRHGLRASLRKMTGFRRRRSEDQNKFTVLSSIDSNIVARSSDRSSYKAGTISPSSAQSYLSTSSSPTMNTTERTSNDDEEAIKRTMDAPEMRSLQEQQLLERARFLAYQRKSLSKLREQHRLAKQRIHNAHEEAACEIEEKVGQA